MMPRKVIVRREPSDYARHTTRTPFACNAPLVMNFEKSHRGSWESLLVLRCGSCGSIQSVDGVMD
jgi:hypothetical protein